MARSEWYILDKGCPGRVLPVCGHQTVLSAGQRKCSRDSHACGRTQPPLSCFGVYGTHVTGERSRKMCYNCRQKCRAVHVLPSFARSGLNTTALLYDCSSAAACSFEEARAGQLDSIRFRGEPKVGQNTRVNLVSRANINGVVRALLAGVCCGVLFLVGFIFYDRGLAAVLSALIVLGLGALFYPLLTRWLALWGGDSGEGSAWALRQFAEERPNIVDPDQLHSYVLRIFARSVDTQTACLVLPSSPDCFVARALAADGKITDSVVDSAPLVGGALGGPPGAALGAAIKALAGIFGITKGDPTPEEVSVALKADPEMNFKLRQADYQFTLELRRLDKEELALQLADIQSARNADAAKTQATGTRDTNLYVLAWTMIACFFILVGILLFNPVPQDQSGVIFMLFGSIATAFGSVISFFFGSSRGSQAKDVLLANSTPLNGGVKK